MEEIGLQNEDVIDVLLEQIGWCMADAKDFCEEASATDKHKEKKWNIQPRESFIITLNDETNENTFFKVNKKTRLSKIAYEYAERKGLYAPALRFLFDGNNIDEIHRTLEEIGVENDYIEVTEISGLPI